MTSSLTPEQRQYAYEQNQRAAERQHDRTAAFSDKANDAARTSSETVLKYAFLMNGGAAVSVLAFIGGLVGQGRVTVHQLSVVSGSLIGFASGVAFALTGFGLAYLTHYTHVGTSNSRKRVWEYPYVIDGPTTWRWSWTANAFHAAALLATILSLVAFVCGLFDVRGAIVHLGDSSPQNPAYMSE